MCTENMYYDKDAPIDTDDIARGFRQIMSLSESERNRISEASANLMNTRFNKETIVEHIEELMYKYGLAGNQH